jgi:predicted short-subunit dehydrogenase-like oxidoreductase (DUF2520 family)
MRRVAIVGAGKVGLVLGRLMRRGGASISAVVSRTERSAREGGRFLRCRNAGTDPAAIPPDTTLIFVAVPHDEVRGVAVQLARLDHLRFRRLAVCHASGMLTAEALSPLARRGATVFSFHPLQTFPRDFPPAEIVPSARGIRYGVDGDAAGMRAARRLAALLDGRVFPVPPALRAYYHASCVLASNHLAAMLGLLQGMHARLGAGGEGFFTVYEPILRATLENIRRTSPEHALSGPVARGGLATVAEHFDAIRRTSPELLPYFTRMSRETAALAARKGTLTGARLREMLALIESTTTETEPRRR